MPSPLPRSFSAPGPLPPALTTAEVACFNSRREGSHPQSPISVKIFLSRPLKPSRRHSSNPKTVPGNTDKDSSAHSNAPTTRDQDGIDADNQRADPVEPEGSKPLTAPGQPHSASQDSTPTYSPSVAPDEGNSASVPGLRRNSAHSNELRPPSVILPNPSEAAVPTNITTGLVTMDSNPTQTHAPENSVAANQTLTNGITINDVPANGISANGVSTSAISNETLDREDAPDEAADDRPVQALTPTPDNGQKKGDDGVDSDYPILPAIEPGVGSRQAGPLTTGGVRFAPLRVPLYRRAQMAAICLQSTFIFLCVALFFACCANILLWPLIIVYLIRIMTSPASTDGKLSHWSETFRSLPYFRFIANYFPMRLHKTHDLVPTRKYIFGYHPHGIISLGAWAAFATNALGFNKLFPGITASLLTLHSNFTLPFYRDWVLALGLSSVSKDSILNLLSRGGYDGGGSGRAVVIVLGGARESLMAQPGTLRLILHGRKGFVKLALQTGADLVPVLAFGENDLYDQLDPATYPTVHRIQKLMLRILKFTLPALYGRGMLNYDIGFLPYRRPLNIVVGKPIPVEQTPAGDTPEQAEIDRLHGLYVAELQKIWDTYKDQFAADRKSELQFIG